MDFRPTHVHFQYHPDGTETRIETWNYDTIAGWELIGSFMNIVAMVFTFTLVSPYLLYMAITDFSGRINVSSIIGIITGSLVIYDAMNGGFFTMLMNIFANEWFMNIIVTLNVIAVITHIFLLVFGVFVHKFIVKWYDTEQARINAFIVLMILVISCSKLYAGTLFKEGWLEKNITEKVEKRKALDKIENEERRIRDSINETIVPKKGDYNYVGE